MWLDKLHFQGVAFRLLATCTLGGRRGTALLVLRLPELDFSGVGRGTRAALNNRGLVRELGDVSPHNLGLLG
jgi:hypothetical protein